MIHSFDFYNLLYNNKFGLQKVHGEVIKAKLETVLGPVVKHRLRACSPPHSQERVGHDKCINGGACPI